MDNEIQNWAIKRISMIDPTFCTLSRDAQLQEDLFSSGRLDSMELMNYLVDAEQSFEFTFTPESFQDRRLHSIHGLSELVSELKR